MIDIVVEAIQASPERAVEALVSYITNVAQSTIGNAYGVYDMSGGVNEYVMDNYNKTAGNSGLTVTNTENTMIASILGDAVGETTGWYEDKTTFIDSSGSWFRFEGYYGDMVSAGAFFSDNTNGSASSHTSFRPPSFS